MRELDFSYPEVSKEERMRDYNRKYRVAHSNTIECKCGGKFKQISKYTHFKTSKHTNYLATLNTNGGH
jgi:uncharacterized protein YktA (UPF0223 family)